MKAAIFDTAGNPFRVLEIKELPKPSPKNGEVLVKVIASPINPSDTMFVQNLYGIRPVFPSPAGFEGVGIIEETGEGVSLAVGTRVSFTTIGAWAEYAIAVAKTVIPVPETMPDDVAAQLFVNPFTAYAMVLDSGVEAGGWLMLSAAGSAFGKMVIQVCKLKDIKTIGTVRRPDMIAELKALGATEIIDTSIENVAKRVKEITNGQGVPCILEAISGQAAAEIIPCLSQGGKMLVYGSLSVDNIPLNAGTMIFKEITLKGFWLSSWLRTANPEARKEVMTNVVKLLSSGEIVLPIEQRYPLDNIKDAVTHADTEGRRGKILVMC